MRPGACYATRRQTSLHRRMRPESLRCSAIVTWLGSAACVPNPLPMKRASDEALALLDSSACRKRGWVEIVRYADYAWRSLMGLRLKVLSVESRPEADQQRCKVISCSGKGREK